MHSIADVLAGLLLSALLLPVLMYTALYLDFWLVSSPLSAPVTLFLSFLAIWIYPSSGRWTPARGETTAILGSYIGAQMGFWLLVQLGYLTTGGMKEAFVWDRWNLAHIVIRSVIGGIVGGIAKTGSKPVWIRFSCYLAGIDHRRYENSRNLFVELFYKFWSYATLGMMVVSVSPLIFSILGIQRESFLSELTP
ncbi:uncharacterized protein LOC111698447 [Eurytemora carolleeae]|uniref:uncharacterized protein LOC111698447 n=1 Tax=Eurytemora carolleeae TaxID=1294199 RepID=UPI000C789908|nr:uncharacterized protein LOC111698447 [Eurytemora carolleeae]|eukprot:XP_023324559.1 uncharacterized protein LOC111698447 [Eurytemora affinis]